MDLSLERTVEVRRRLAIEFEVPLISVAGTNGKGSTCAMLESIALQAGYRVGALPEARTGALRGALPHRRPAPSRREALLPHFEAVEAARGEITLTKFEFTTLAIARLLAASGARSGDPRGRAWRPLRRGQCLRCRLRGDHQHRARSHGVSRPRPRVDRLREGAHHAAWPSGDRQRPAAAAKRGRACGGDRRRPVAGRPRFQHQRRSSSSGRGAGGGSASTRWPIRPCAVPTSCSMRPARWPHSRRCANACRSPRRRCATASRLVELPGRFQIVPGQPTLVLDVAHNPHAVATLVHNLDQMGFFPRTHVVFGVMADKDIAAMLTRLAPLVDNWYFTDLPSARAAERAGDLAALARQPGSCAARGRSALCCHADPQQAHRCGDRRRRPG